MTGIETQASLTAFGYPPSWVTAVIVQQTSPQRFSHALAGLGLFWAFALGGLFIPVAHFILVPAFASDRRSRYVTMLADLVRGSYGMHGSGRLICTAGADAARGHP